MMDVEVSTEDNSKLNVLAPNVFQGDLRASRQQIIWQVGGLYTAPNFKDIFGSVTLTNRAFLIC